MATETTTTHEEYRICGDDGPMGDWQGQWRSGQPSAHEMFGARHSTKRSRNVRIERRRRVETITPLESIPVPSSEETSA